MVPIFPGSRLPPLPFPESGWSPAVEMMFWGRRHFVEEADPEAHGQLLLPQFSGAG